MPDLTLSDDDAGTITASVGGRVVREWLYQPVGFRAIRSDQMRLAREFAEGWYLAMKHKQQEDKPT